MQIKGNKFIKILVLIILTSSIFGFLGGVLTNVYFYQEIGDYFSKIKIPLLEQGQKFIEQEVLKKEYVLKQEEVVINTVEEVSPSVVSIIITKDLPVFEKYYYNPFEGFEFRVPGYRQKGTKEQEIGGGTGFIISKDGMILTNKHVVVDKEADYTVLTNEGKRFPAKVLATDPFQDLAILKIEKEKVVNDNGKVEFKDFKPVKLGDSDNLQPGQTVIAIGNALGEFRNTVSVGVISGLKRTITASGGGFSETLEDVIQTDAAINKGNSGGPLLNLRGEVIGINTAMAQAENIGFAIPINKAKRDIEQVKKRGEIVYPFLGIRYTVINKELKEEFNLKVDYGAWIGRNALGQKVREGVVSGSAADKAGLQQDDIILQFNKEKVTQENPLSDIIMKYEPDDKVSLRVLRNGKEITLEATLGEISE